MQSVLDTFSGAARRTVYLRNQMRWLRASLQHRLSLGERTPSNSTNDGISMIVSRDLGSSEHTVARSYGWKCKFADRVATFTRILVSTSCDCTGGLLRAKMRDSSREQICFSLHRRLIMYACKTLRLVFVVNPSEHWAQLQRVENKISKIDFFSLYTNWNLEY